MRLILCLLGLLTLAACAEPKWADDAAVTRAVYTSQAPTSVTLFTVVRKRDGSSGHSGLMVNGAQRIIFDPAGSWNHPDVPERNDVLYGMTDKMVAFYIDYHARETYDVVEQTVPVTPQVAAMVAQRMQSYGAVPKAHCARAITGVLDGVPGFEDVGRTWYPTKLMQRFDQLPGVVKRTITDDSADKNHGVLLVQAGDPRLTN
ncbi:hypothetical protein [Falsirhodobacter xinxiangensis]|uniref:hypothetical protein n=1 Tax=Falsirhodobacter xinxiangensis TaxID=2530049 RepID=UPI0010AA1F30|nr:hypothetical protein [Rhodobacter xinxiangensis]